MNLKKINIYTVRDFIDGLIEKIPPKILTPIIHVMYIIAGLLILFGIYYGAKLGYASAKQEGQELGKDTKTLFQEEIERTHNKRKRGLRTASDSSGIYIESTHEIEKIFPERDNLAKTEVSKPEENLMKRDEEFRPKQDKLLQDISGANKLASKPEDKFEIDSTLDDSNFYERTLRETPNYNYRVLERKNKESFRKEFQSSPSKVFSDTQKPNISPPE